MRRRSRDLPASGRDSARPRAGGGARARAVRRADRRALDDRFRLLTRRRTALPRQQTLRALIDWSYDLLAEGAHLFAACGFAGGWTLEAAEAVCSRRRGRRGGGAGPAADLVDKSLVRCGGGGGRYRLLETVRQYADKNGCTMSGEERGSPASVISDFYLAFAEKAGVGTRRARAARLFLQQLDVGSGKRARGARVLHS